jgi:ABC-type Zn uptake system ZnuABC Zn-binding protein ZnuA
MVLPVLMKSEGKLELVMEKEMKARCGTASSFLWAGLAVCLLLLLTPGCQTAGERKVSFEATIPPLSAILQELTKGRAEVGLLIPPGASPHAFDPSPALARRVAQARAVFHVDRLTDGWVAELAGEQAIAVLELVPEQYRMEMVLPCEHEHHEHNGHRHGVTDPHFWTSPRTVKALLPALADQLAELDPAGTEDYRSNAEAFTVRLDALDEELTELLKPVEGQALVLFHPSFRYLLRDYGLELAAVIEPSPGMEPSPRDIVQLQQIAAEQGVSAVFTEPQLPPGPARALADAAGLPLYELDPLGGGEGRSTYLELLRYNAQTIARALAAGAGEQRMNTGPTRSAGSSVRIWESGSAGVKADGGGCNGHC